MNDLTIHGLALEYDRRHPDDIPLIVASKALADLTPEEKRTLLVRAIASEVETVRRESARRIERDSFAPAVARSPALLHRNSREYKEWLATPEGQESLARDDELKQWQEARRSAWRSDPSSAPRNTLIYREWIATTAEGKAFETRRLETEAEEAEKERLWRDEPEEYDRRYGLSALWASWRGMIEGVREQARIELTAELLGSSFALGDGRSVKWGEATLDDHRHRVEMLMRHVEGNTKTIELHHHAAQILRETGAPNLNRSKAITFA